jgi:hypothetical protein
MIVACATRLALSVPSASNKHIGSSLASFLDEEGVREDVGLRAEQKIQVDSLAKKNVLAGQRRTKSK